MFRLLQASEEAIKRSLLTTFPRLIGVRKLVKAQVI